MAAIAIVAVLVAALLVGLLMRRRWLTVSMFALLMPLSALGAVLGWIAAYGMNRCDESCDGPGWENSMDGWQWDATFLTAAAGAAAVWIAALLAWRGRRSAAVASVALAVLAFAGFAILNAPLTSDY